MDCPTTLPNCGCRDCWTNIARLARNGSRTKRNGTGGVRLVDYRFAATAVVFHRSVRTNLKVHRKTVKRQWEKMSRRNRQVRIWKVRRPEGRFRQARVDPRVPDDAPQSTRSPAQRIGRRDDDRATLEEEQLQAEEDAQFEAASAATLGPLDDVCQELFCPRAEAAGRDDRSRRAGSRQIRCSHRKN
jgi:hypothetical protein